MAIDGAGRGGEKKRSRAEAGSESAGGIGGIGTNPPVETRLPGPSRLAKCTTVLPGSQAASLPSFLSLFRRRRLKERPINRQVMEKTDEDEDEGGDEDDPGPDDDEDAAAE